MIEFKRGCNPFGPFLAVAAAGVLLASSGVARAAPAHQQLDWKCADSAYIGLDNGVPVYIGYSASQGFYDSTDSLHASSFCYSNTSNGFIKIHDQNGSCLTLFATDFHHPQYYYYSGCVTGKASQEYINIPEGAFDYEFSSGYDGACMAGDRPLGTPLYPVVTCAPNGDHQQDWTVPVAFP